MCSVFCHLPDLLDLLSQNFQTLFNRLFKPYGYLADSSEGSSDEVWVSLRDVFLELVEDWFIVLVVDNSNQNLSELTGDLHLLVFDVVWFCEFAEEAFLLFVLQDLWPFLHDVLDVLKQHILDLWLVHFNQTHQTGTYLLTQILNQVFVRQEVQIFDHNFDASKHNCWVDV